MLQLAVISFIDCSFNVLINLSAITDLLYNVLNALKCHCYLSILAKVF